MFAGATTTHSLEHGFRTTLIEDGCRGVSLEDIAHTRASLLRQGAAVVSSADVSNNIWTIITPLDMCSLGEYVGGKIYIMTGLPTLQS